MTGSASRDQPARPDSGLSARFRTASPGRAAAAPGNPPVARLIETRPDIPVPGSHISFYVHGHDAPAVMAAVARALPCRWTASVSRGEHEWLRLTSGPAGAVSGTWVDIAAPAADACTRAGTRTVTVWQPAA